MDASSQPPESDALLVDVYDTEGVVREMRDTLRTTHALFFHQRERMLALTTVHPVTTTREGMPEVGPGRPLSYEDEQSILALLGSRAEEASIEILPERVLYRDPSTLLWWLPAAVRPMHLRTHAEGLRTIEAHWPALAFLVRERSLYLAALACDARPTADTPLFHAPLGNVYADTGVCTGSARLPEGPETRHITAWEAVITDTAFTHTNHDATLRAPGTRKRGSGFVKTDASFWLKRASEGPLPVAQFNPLGITLGEWLPRLRASERSGRVGPRRPL
jgi:PRTRC genetic system protein B